jgi:hypothetical protein
MNLLGVVFWIYLLFAGIGGFSIFYNNKLKEWNEEKKTTHFFKKNINKIFVTLLVFIALSYLMQKVVGGKYYAFLLLVFFLILGAAYYTAYLLKKTIIKYQVDLRFVSGTVVLIIFGALSYNAAKEIIFVDFKKEAVRKEFFFTKEKDTRSIYLNEYNKIYFSPQITGWIYFSENNKKKNELKKFSPKSESVYYEANKAGYFILKIDEKVNKQGALVVTIEKGFYWERVLLKNHTTLRYALLYLVLLFFAILLMPKKILLTKGVLMKQVGKDISEPKEMETYLTKYQDDSSALVALYRSWREKFGNRLDIKHMLEQVKNIETRKKSLTAYREYLEERKRLENLELVGQRDKKKIELEIAQIDAEMKNIKAQEKTGKKVESSLQEVLKSYEDQTLIILKELESQQEIIKKAYEICDKIKKERPDDGDKIADEMMRVWYAKGIFAKK